MSAFALLTRPVPAVTRNGLPWKPYVYQGDNGPDLLTPEIDALPDNMFGRGASDGTALAPCGTEAAYARHRRRGEPIDEVCREGNSRINLARREARKAANPWCGKCRYQLSSQNHRILCGAA